MGLDAEQLKNIEGSATDLRDLIIAMGKKIDGTNGTGFINEISGAFSTNFQDYILGFKIIISVWLTAWIIYEGLQIAYGRNNKNVKDFMWDSFMKFVFISVCLYPDVFTNMLKNALDGIREYTLGNGRSSNLYELLGDFAYNVSKATNIMTTSSGFFNIFSDKPNAIVAYLSAIICYIGFFCRGSPSINNIVYKFTIFLFTCSSYSDNVFLPNFWIFKKCIHSVDDYDDLEYFYSRFRNPVLFISI